MDKATSTTPHNLRGIPANWNGNQTTKSHVQALVIEAWPQFQDHTINVQTLDFDPDSLQLMAATLSLDNLSATLVTPPGISATVTDAAGELHHLQLTQFILTEKQKACFQDLSFPDQNYREADIELAQGTCDWIIHHDSFCEWPDAPRKLLWVCGPSGAGKSAVMKRITQHLKDSESAHDRLLLSYFFDGRASFIHNSREGCYRHLLTQMLRNEPGYIAELERMDGTLRDPQQLIDSWNSMADFLQFHCLGFLPGIAKKIPVTFVIDGLEEAGAMEMVKELLTTVQRSNLDVRLCISCHDPAGWASNGDVRIDVEMHNRHDIWEVVQQRMERFEGQEEIDWTELENHIQQKAAGNFQWARVVADEMARLQRDAGYQSPDLERRLESIPNDLPRLYQTLMEDLDAQEDILTLQSLQWLCFARRPLSTAELQELRDPRGLLGPPYPIEKSLRSLVEIKTRREQSQADAPRLNKVQFVHHSIPSYLLNGGLRHLSGVDFKSTAATVHRQFLARCLVYLKRKEVLEEERERSETAEKLLRIDASLTSEDHLTSDDVLRVSEDIETVAKAWNLDLQPNHNLSVISDLSSSEAKPHLQKIFSWLAETIARQTREKFHFAEYLVSSLNYHLRELDDAGVALLNLVDDSFWSPEASPFDTWRYLSIVLHPCNKLASVFDTSNPIGRPTGRTTPLHYIAEHSFLSSLPLALANHLPVHLSLHDATGHTPLTTAITSRNYNVASAILSSPKIDPNTPDTTPTRRTPLIHAVRLLLPLRRDANLSNGDTAHATALLKTLLANPGTNPSLRDAAHRTPLSHAAETGSLYAFTTILDAVVAATTATDAQPPTDNSDGSSIAPTIATTTTTVDEQDDQGRTPLSYAAEAASAAVVKKLLSTSMVRPDLPDARGMTPLDYALRTEGNRWGVGRVVGLLLGAQEIRKTGRGPMEPKEVLEWAVERGRAGIVQSVLEEEWKGKYIDAGLLRRVKEMVGVDEGSGVPRRVWEDGGDGEEGARLWIRDFLPHIEMKTENLNDIKRLMEERRRKKKQEEEEEKAKEKAKVVVQAVKVSSKL